jgi:predicted GIY-YIG superfamily endonuclease
MDDMWFLYLIECETPRHYYVGISSQPLTRERNHRAGSGKGSPFTQLHGVKTFELLAVYNSREEAERVEQQFTDDLREDGTLVVAGGKGACAPVEWPKATIQRSRGASDSEATPKGGSF